MKRVHEWCRASRRGRAAEGVVDVVRVVGVQQVLLGYEVGDEDLLDQEVNQRLLVFLGVKFTLGLSYILSSYES